MRPAQTPEARSACFTVGLTGGVGCGKSTVAHGFESRNIAVIDADVIAHALTAADGAAMPAIVEIFGAALRQASGALDRDAMRRLVFSDKTARTRLEAILHPMIRQACFEQLAQARSAYALLVVPLLVESEVYKAHCDRILVVDCPPETQLYRVMQRSKLSETEALQIMAAQTSREIRLAAASEVLDNSADLSTLDTRIEALHRLYLLESSKPARKS